jgi:ubiquinone/menaquinone biosynthesis C-methylase UbiE
MMLGRRREHGLSKTAAASIEWREGSALSLPFASNSFDLALCQLGLQFFPDRPLAIREMKRVLVPSGRVGLGVYSAIERTSAAAHWRALSITAWDQMRRGSNAANTSFLWRTKSAS